MRTADAEGHDVDQCPLHRAVREQRERVVGHGAVVAGPLDRVLERLVAPHVGDGLLEVAIADGPLLQRAPPEGALGLAAAAKGEDHRQRDLALAEIVADVLAEPRVRAAIVEHVVDELEGDAEVHPERAAGRLLVPWAPGEDRPDLAGGSEELRRLASNHGEVLVLRRRRVLGRRELSDLAFGDHGRGARQDVEGAQRADLHHHLERLAEEEIADEHTRPVAPHHAGRRLAPAHVAFVDHVVVEEGRGMHELDGRGELDMALALVAGELRGGEREHWPQPLAAGLDEVVRDVRDHCDLGAGAGEDGRIDAGHVGFRQGDDPLDGPRLGLVFECDDDTQALPSDDGEP